MDMTKPGQETTLEGWNGLKPDWLIRALGAGHVKYYSPEQPYLVGDVVTPRGVIVHFLPPPVTDVSQNTD